MTQYKLFNNDDTSANESAVVNLPSGRAIYKISGARPHTKKDNGDFSVVFNFTSASGERYTHFVPIGGPAMNADRARIGRSLNKALWDACGLKGDASIERLPNFVGKFVDMTVTAGGPDGNGGQWPPRLGPVYPATGFDGGAASTPAAASPVLNSPDDQIPGVDSPSAEAPAQAAPVQTPAPVKTWKRVGTT